MEEENIHDMQEVFDMDSTASGIYHSPLAPKNMNTLQEIEKSKRISTSSPGFRQLFQKDETDEHKKNKSQLPLVQSQKNRGTLLGQVLSNTNKPPIKIQKNERRQISYTESINQESSNLIERTPFRNPIFSPISTPLSVYRKNNMSRIDFLKKKKKFKIKIEQISLDRNLSEDYAKQGGAYFVGLALYMKKFNHKIEQLWFYRIACYIEPYNQQTWLRYTECLRANNLFDQFIIASKTAFLFNYCTDFAINYLTYGEKFKVPTYQLRSLLFSLNQPEAYDKLIQQSARIEMRNRKVWRGLVVLLQFCRIKEFKPDFCQIIIFLCKQLENLGTADSRNYAMIILSYAFSKSLSALEAGELYLQMLVRSRKGKLTQSDFNDLDRLILNRLSQETQYRFALSIAEHCIDDQQKFYKWIKKAFDLAEKYFSKGCGQSRAMRTIYFTASKYKLLPIAQSRIQQNNPDNLALFEANRYQYITQQQLIRFDFSEWKFYIHFSLSNNDEMLRRANQKWPHVGRLVAERLHILRRTLEPLQMLKKWRSKIDGIPKSGELWCEGGRIYIELGQYSNAIKCFQNAIHFTPQYGDSFFELLKVYLIQGSFFEIEQLKKKYLVQDPVYGFLSTYWRFCGDKYNYLPLTKLSLIETWNLAKKQILKQLYKTRPLRQLSASTQIQNYKIDCPSRTIRQRLFLSYEQFDKKS